MGQGHRYCEYRRPVWPWEWGRWLARRRDHQAVSDGRDYVGWAARLHAGDWPRPAGTVGAVVDSRVQCGQLVHAIDFDGWWVSTPLPSRYFTLIPPARR